VVNIFLSVSPFSPAAAMSTYPAYPASAIHRIRLSQVPLSSQEPALPPADYHSFSSHAADLQQSALEKPALKESMRHSVRYNIVGEHWPVASTMCQLLMVL
jgi:hypothetical protein